MGAGSRYAPMSRRPKPKRDRHQFSDCDFRESLNRRALRANEELYRKPCGFCVLFRYWFPVLVWAGVFVIAAISVMGL